MSSIAELKKYFPKDLIHLFLAYNFDELEIADTAQEEKLVIQALKSLNCGPDGCEPKISPNLNDAKICKKYCMSDNALEWYVYLGSEYLTRKFMDKKQGHNIIKYDTNMYEILKELKIYTPENLCKAILSRSNRYSELYKKALTMFTESNDENLEYFEKIFWHLRDMENYDKCVTLMGKNIIREENNNIMIDTGIDEF